MSWYRDPRHPELGALYIGEDLAVPPGMEEIPTPSSDTPLSFLAREREDAVAGVARAFDVPPEMLGDVPDRAYALADAMWADVGGGGGIVSNDRAAWTDSPSETDFTWGTLIQEWEQLADTTRFRLYGYVDVRTPSDTTPTPADPEHTVTEWTGTTPPQVPAEELERRLAAGLCYWCGRAMNTDDPYELFCREEHSVQWRRSTCADPEVVRQTEYSHDYASGEQPVEPGDTPPSWLGDSRPAAVVAAAIDAGHRAWATQQRETRGHRYGREAARRPTLIEDPYHEAQPHRPQVESHSEAGTTVPIVASPALDNRWDWKIVSWPEDSVPLAYGLEHTRLNPPGIVPGPDSLTLRAGQSFAIGRPRIDDQPALRSLPAGPWPDRTEWPARTMRWMEADGWSFALATGVDRAALRAYEARPDHAVLPVRHCPRCDTTGPSAVHTAEFAFPRPFPSVRMAMDWDPIAERERETTPDAYTTAWKVVSQIVCAHCYLPYPGPMAVPMVRLNDTFGRWELAVVTTTGWRSECLSVEALEQLYPGVLTDLWVRLYEYVLEQASGWECIHPTCHVKAHKWMSLSAGMVWAGMMLEPSDGEPLLLGLCPMHEYDLYRDIYTSVAMIGRTPTLGLGLGPSGLTVV